MHPTLWRRFRALFAASPETGVELVLVGNAYTAVAIGVVSLFEADLTLSSALWVTGALFIALTAFLLFRRTIWISASLGSIAIGIAPALLLGSFARRLHPIAQWPAAVLGLAIGGAVAFKTYADVGSRTRGGS